MDFKKTAFAALALMAAASLTAQDVWSLERCVRHAQETNLAVKQAEFGVKSARIAQTQAEKSRLPNLGFGTSLGAQTGRSFNQITGEVTTSTVIYNGLQLNGSVPIYQGGQIKNTIDQSKIDVAAAQADAQSTANDLALQVASSFLQCLLTEENLENLKKRLVQTNEQLARTDKLIAAGTLPQNGRLTILAQIAREEGQVIQGQNQIDLAYLGLKNLLFLEPDYPIRLERPAVAVPSDVSPDALGLKTLFNAALGTQPQIRAGELRIKSAQIGEDVARSQFLPTVSLNANAGSNWNSQFIQVTGQGPTQWAEQTVRINGQDVRIETPYSIPITGKVPYFDQLFDRNPSFSVSISAQAPIYQNHRARLGVERAKLATLQAQNQNAQARQRLKNDIQTAIANAKSAKKTYEAAEKTVVAFKAAFENAQKRYDLGALNSLELSQAKTNFDTATTDQTVAKYDLIFRLKILDFYQGKQISLD